MATIDTARRRFLQGLLLGGLLPWLPRSSIAASDDYKALVCVFLHGGNDAFNMLVPNTASAWSAYQALRGDLAVPRDQLLPLSGLDHGFHPRLTHLQGLFDQGRLAIVANVGNLVEPLTAEQYLAWEEGDAAVQVPPELYSHADQSHFWQTSRAPNQGQDDSGWGGRIIDHLQATNGNPDVPIGMSLDGHSLWLQGSQENQLVLNSWDGMEGFEDFENQDWPPWAASRAATWQALLDHRAAGGPLHRQLVAHLGRARSRATAVQEALALSWRCNDQGEACNDGFATPYDADNDLAAQLRMVGRMIHARSALGQGRQIFVTASWGWDTHGSQAREHPERLGELDAALGSFQGLLEELGVADRVTTFVASEFGRTLGHNGDGTDHGWGSHWLVMGGAVAGGRVFGELPELARGAPLDVSDALLPTQSTAQFGATLARWLGVAEGDLPAIFPHLGNFDRTDLGFFTSS